MGYTIILDFADVQRIWSRGEACAPFRDEQRQHGRFEVQDPSVGPQDELESHANRLFASSAFDHGSVLWCANYVEAMLVAKVHRAAGYTAYICWDIDANLPDAGGGYCVLTTWDIDGTG